MRITKIRNEYFQIDIYETDFPGSTLCLVGGAHGNEMCGVKAIKKVNDRLFTESLLKKGRLHC